MRSVLRYGFACLRTGSVRLLAAAFLIITMAFSQMSSISGTVKDQSGARVSSAMVIAHRRCRRNQEEQTGGCRRCL